MKKKVVLFIILVAGLALNALSRDVAVIDLTERNQDPASHLISLRYALDVAGVDYHVTTDVSQACTSAIAITTSTLRNETFTAAERDSLRNYVQRGGVLISPNVTASQLLTLYGVGANTYTTNRTRLTWDTSGNDESLSWFDDPMEQTISLGSTDGAIGTRGYVPASAATVATFGDGTAAVTCNNWGLGYAYCLGFSWQDVILRNQMDMDFSAQRVYSNGFEPTSDTICLFLRGLVQKYIPYAVWKHTLPENAHGVMIFTHDVDCESSMLYMYHIAQWEYEHGIKATYPVTTHYVSDDMSIDYINPYISNVGGLLAWGHEVASHSVSHAPDFDDETVFTLGTIGQTPLTYRPYCAIIDSIGTTVTNGGNVYGEMEVSKNFLEDSLDNTVRTYRQGYLLWNNYMAGVADTLGYLYDSTNSAADVLTSFPYFCQVNRSFLGRQSNLMEIPMNISDVNMTESNWQERINVWHTVFTQNCANFAPTVLLIHPNYSYKLQSETAYYNLLPNHVLYMGLGEYGDFWRQRLALNYSTSLADSVLTVSLAEGAVLNGSQSLVIENGSQLLAIHVVDTNGSDVETLTDDLGNDMLLVRLGRSVAADDVTQTGKNNLKVYPNPFNPRCSISFDLPKAGKAKVTVYDARGRKVSTLVNSQLTAGTHRIDFTANGLASGVYFTRVECEDWQQTAKMLLLK